MRWKLLNYYCKTSILFRIAHDTFTEPHVTTIGIEFKIKTVYIEVYDVTNQRSFENVPSWIQEIERYTNENVIKMSQKVVDPFLAQELADSLDITFKEISTKQSINIEDAFVSLVKLCINKIEETSQIKTQSPEKNNFRISPLSTVYPWISKRSPVRFLVLFSNCLRSLSISLHLLQ
ncbi:hypothetical protein ACTFIY_003799 [Dictyostelium cf. discoideum]